MSSCSRQGPQGQKHLNLTLVLFCAFLCRGYPQPPCLDQEEFAKRAEWPELFIQGNSCSSLQSGILVLINDADWELLNYQLQNQDSILFNSTLHGG